MTRRTEVQQPTALSDTHMYIDMSGDLGDKDWLPLIADQVERMRKVGMALQTTLTLHLTAFSHKLSDDAAPIEVTDSYPTRAELAELILAMPRAWGGTDFGLVYASINGDPERSDRHNVIVTDLQWGCDVARMSAEHPINLDYHAIERTIPADRTHFSNLLARLNLPEGHYIS